MCNIPDDVLEKLQKDVSEIKVALLGNEYNPEGGLLYRVKEIENTMNYLEDCNLKTNEKINKVFWVSIGVVGTITIIWNIIKDLFIK